MKELLKDPEANKEILSAHKVDTSIMRKRQKQSEGQAKETASSDDASKTQLTQKKRMYHLNKPTKKTTWNRNQNRPQTEQQAQTARV